MRNKIKIWAVAIIVVVTAIIFANPRYPFNKPYSVVVTDSSGIILGAHIASDGQWRFPAADSVPYKFSQCLIQYEDRRFNSHPGIDIIAIARATISNIRKGHIVSGGSTITMQTVRLSSPKSRTIWAKIGEAIQAVRLELKYSKTEILKMYASHAPFGGNTVGLETASQRYFGRSSHTLSWAESAMLAVLPNNPALIHLGRNRESLLRKRNQLIQRLQDDNIIDSETSSLAQQEPLPEAPRPYPMHAPHLLTRISQTEDTQKQNPTRTTIDIHTQLRAQQILSHHIKELRADGIQNAAIMIMEIESGNIVAYIGNTQRQNNRDDANDVDIIQSPRSTGSILKPFLYCAMLSEGQLLPNTLVPDIPTQISGYMPRNYRLTYDGAVPASKALARSLNVPAVKMLQQYSGEKFINILKKLKITTITQPAEHYGLSLILGGCEANLYQLCGAYASMARSLKHYTQRGNTYSPSDYRQPNYLYSRRLGSLAGFDEGETSSFLSAGAIYHTMKALTTVERPENETSHDLFSSDTQVAWKTGTSFGFRDAWAIGVTGNYVIGVWTGNADGEGRPKLVGIKASAPILFDLVKILPHQRGGFPVPYDDLTEARLCAQSGHLASPYCTQTTQELIPASGANSSSCPYCHLVHLDKSGQYRVTADMEDPSDIKHENWFTLPPAMEYYYRQHNSSYRMLPPMRPDCATMGDPDQPIQIIYPEEGARLFLPVGFDGNRQKMIIEATCRNPESKLYWHLDHDESFVTDNSHKISVAPIPGKHTLTITDSNGNKVTRHFEIQ